VSCTTSATPASASLSADPRLTSILESYSDVFEQKTTGLVDDLAPPSVTLIPDSIPPNRPAFRLSLPERQELESQVTKMLEKGWIQPSRSPYGAPVLFVPKPDGSLRMCIDYRALNKLTLKNKYPLPRIEDLLDNLSGARYFSSLDLTSGYHQLRLPASDIPKTAFNTHFGKFEWRVLPMGLSKAPAVFQSVMNRLFSKYLNKNVLIYLDDILIFSKTEEEHYAHLSQVLAFLRQCGLKAKMSKCDFFKAELKFMGHIVSSSGMKPDPAKVQVVVDWPVPQTTFEVRSFLGLANYFRKYIRGFAAMVAPLTNLLKGLSKHEKEGRLLLRGRLSPAAEEARKRDFAAQWTEAVVIFSVSAGDSRLPMGGDMSYYTDINLSYFLLSL
jgi:AcrR family transcriptional regulator